MGIAFADWYKVSKEDPFDDQVYVMFRSKDVNGVFLSLTCGSNNYSKYDYPSVVVHNTKDTWSVPLDIKKIQFRIDKNKTIYKNKYNDENKEARYYWTEIYDEKITKQLFSGYKLLISIGGESPISLSLKGITAASIKMDKLCKKQVGKNGHLKQQHESSTTETPIWIKK